MELGAEVCNLISAQALLRRWTDERTPTRLEARLHECRRVAADEVCLPRRPRLPSSPHPGDGLVDIVERAA